MSTLTKMKFEEYAESLWDFTHVYTTLIDEMYWGGGFNEDLMIRVTNREAAKEGIELVDLEKLPSSYFYQMYQVAEKGLS